MFQFFIISLSLLLVVGGIKSSNSYNNKNKKDYSKSSIQYPSGYELKNELRNIPIYEYDISNLNLDSIENFIFRDYVYNYEINRWIYKRSSFKKSFR